MKDIITYINESSDDYVQQIIRKPYEEGYFEEIGLDMKILQPYINWKLYNGKMPSKSQIINARYYLSDLINDPNKDVDDYDEKDVIYTIDDELDILYMYINNK